MQPEHNFLFFSLRTCNLCCLEGVKHEDRFVPIKCEERVKEKLSMTVETSALGVVFLQLMLCLMLFKLLQEHLGIAFLQSCGSRSTGSTCFWASWIRIRIRIRIH